MGENPDVAQPSNRKQEAFKNLIRLLDARIDDPQKRAMKVYAAVKDFPEWDLVCFSVELLAAHINLLDPVRMNLKTVTKFVYNSHYLLGDQLGLWQLSDTEQELKNQILNS